MLRPRIIPCLLVRNGGLVKTVRFGSPKYVGDPLNTVRIFNEKGVDELVVFDVDATVGNREPDYRLIEHLAVECRMPLCYGGGVRTVEQIQRIVGLGVEKIAVSAAAVANPAIVREAAVRVGSQSVVVVMDVKKRGWLQKSEVVTHNGTRAAGLAPVEFAVKCEGLGAGEIVINSVDRDGTMGGYDLELVRRVREATSLPITAVGGAGSHEDIASLIGEFGIIGAGAGSLFVFKGKYRAVLVNYPSRDEKEGILRRAAGDARP